ncbi:pickpocket protein 28-like [Bombus vosnesenskii]|uniref:Pickpocket protein 28-like n=1 Tax=Bombus vosnesenskii TaxID=207650 RepID=A0A6J3KF84_9HYME|nr:pickpocket protein 28-like [Bombus vosnesenskii]
MRIKCHGTRGWYKKKLKNSQLNIAQGVKRFFRDYCQNTGLHGFRYIVTGETTCHKMVWLMICLAAIIFCVLLMLRLWQYYSNNPTVTIIDTSNPIRDLHFPGITICNNNKVYKPHADKIAQKLLNYGFDSDMSNKLFSSLMKLIRPDKIEIDNATASWALDILGYTVERLMLELMHPCNLLLVRCGWLGQLYDCSKIFKTVRSNEGFCCGFNYHFVGDYNDEYAWLMNITMDSEELDVLTSNNSFPGVDNILHVPGTGSDIGLAVALNIDADNYKSSVRQFVGATVLIHDPLDYPDIGAQSASLQPGHVMSMTLTGTKLESSKDIQNIPLSKRMCLFDGETTGERRYSYQTCISECLQQQIYGSCGCLPFFFPDQHPNVRTCYLTDVDCILSRRRSLSVIHSSHINDCSCLPQCNDKSYEVVSESIQINDVGYDSELARGLDVQSTSFLYAYFRDGTYLEYRKQTILGWDSLLASFGGIFGLCLGGSVISLVEFVYYLLVDIFSFLKERTERQDQDLPPASKLFVSVPANMKLKKYSTSNLNKRIYLAWDQQLSQRIRKNSEFTRNMYHE